MTASTSVCPNCGAQRPPLGRFCGSCGQEYPTAVPGTIRAGSGGGVGKLLLWTVGAIVAAGAFVYYLNTRPVGSSPAVVPPVSSDAPTERPTPAPTATPWKLAVDDATYTKEAGIGDNIVVAITITNSGTTRNPRTDINFSDLDKNADLFDCDPKCTKDDLPGLGPSAVFAGVAPGKTVTYTVEFIAKKVGAVDWGVCVYAVDVLDDEVYCGSGATAIR